MKKLLSVVMIAVLMLSAVVPLGAAGEVNVVLDGKTLEFDVPGQIIDGRTMVPLRKIFEAMGATVNYNAATRTAVAKKGDTTVSLTIGDPKIVINGVEKALDVPGLIIDGRTLAPLRAVGEAFGGSVNWNGTTRTATITSKKVTEPAYAFEKNADYLEITKALKTSLAELNPVLEYTEQAGNKLLVVHITADAGTAAALNAYPELLAEAWTELEASMVELSTATAEAFAEKGHAVGCSVQLHNDANYSLVLLATLNDGITYNVMDTLLPAA